MGIFNELFRSRPPPDEDFDVDEEVVEQRIAPPVLDVESVYDAYGVTAEERDRVAKAKHLLQSLPKGASTDAYRAIVGTSLNAFGVSIAEIVAAARHEVDALEAHILSGDREVEQLGDEAGDRIAELEQQIASIRESLRQAEQAHAATTEVARGAVDELRPILSFFEAEEVSHEPVTAVPAGEDETEAGWDAQPAVQEAD